MGVSCATSILLHAYDNKLVVILLWKCCLPKFRFSFIAANQFSRSFYTLQKDVFDSINQKNLTHYFFCSYFILFVLSSENSLTINEFNAFFSTVLDSCLKKDERKFCVQYASDFNHKCLCSFEFS